MLWLAIHMWALLIAAFAIGLAIGWWVAETWIDWLPIHELSRREVFDTIAAAGQEPHWAYGRGMSRLSCSFCIMSCLADLQCAARLRPDLLSAYMALEGEIGHSLRPDGTSLRETLNRLDAA